MLDFANSELGARNSELKKMMNPDDIQIQLSKSLPGADVVVQDLTGTQDHFEVRVLWSGFQGKNLIEQHQMVNKALAAELEDGRIHALKIKTYKA
jgi:stress-induced morphogen